MFKKSLSVLFLLRLGTTFAEASSDEKVKSLESSNIVAKKRQTKTHLGSIRGAAIFDGKKTELILMDEIVGNKATNNARQVFARVPGVTVWESDGGGIQMGIGARGLSPKRSAEFNMRQNGYDMSADALGYPESYYTPPMESVERVEIIRGAASLQYGPQFGGMVNFVTYDGRTATKNWQKHTDPKSRIKFSSRQTVGGFGLFNTFNSLALRQGDFDAYAYVQYKQGDDERDNAGFDQKGAYANLGYQITENFVLRTDLTHMTYLAQQPGGLTDKQFEEDVLQTNRTRNWFAVNWNLLSVSGQWQITQKALFDFRLFGLWANRGSVGSLERADRVDNLDLYRTLVWDNYLNQGGEFRYLQKYSLGKQSAAFLTGLRLYNGNLNRKSAIGSNGIDADFEETTVGSDVDPIYYGHISEFDYEYPSQNISWFTENMFPMGERIRITPGVRVEWIRTQAEGEYRVLETSNNGSISSDKMNSEIKENDRHVFLAGLGSSVLLGLGEIYANVSQNYRGINFNDMRSSSKNLIVDANLKDEEGFNVDLGYRGNYSNISRFDLGLFWLEYNDRIGQSWEFNGERNVRFRRNISDSRHLGFEGYIDLDVWKLINRNSPNKIQIFGNMTALTAKYVNSQDEAIDGNDVELVPEIQGKIGLQAKWDVHSTFKGAFEPSILWSYTASQFTDATNSVSEITGINGAIPAYSTLDVSFRYSLSDLYYGKLSLSGGLQNCLDSEYFTRRSDGYPGPGIIPSTGRNFYTTLSADF